MQPTLQAIWAVAAITVEVALAAIMVKVALHHQHMHLRHHYLNKRCLQIMFATDVSNLDITSEIVRQMMIKHSIPFKVRVCHENISGSVILE